MSQNDTSKNVSINNNLDTDTNINHCKEIFLMIDEHKKKLEELKNNNDENKPENQKFSFNKKQKKQNSNLNINPMDIENSINLAKYFLQKNKEKTLKIFNNIDNKITPYLGLHFNYDDNDNNNNQENIRNNTNYNNTDYNNINYYNFLKQNDTEPNTTKNKNKSINKISLLYNNSSSNSNKIIRSNSRVYTTYNNLYDNSINEDLDKSNKNKILKDKLKRREEKIKKLESNIASLNKENQSLKQYIIQLQHNLLTFNNKKNNNAFNKNLFNDSDSMKSSSMEDFSINDKIEKIMNSINIFIKKMYNLFPNLGCTGDFKDLSYHHPNEVEKKLDKIGKMIHNFFTLKKNSYNSNESSIVDMISTIEYDKNGMKKPKYKNLIKKLENKSSKKAIKKKNRIAYEFNSSGCPAYKSKIKIKSKSNNY